MDAIRYGGELFDSIAAYTYHYITSMNDAETGHSIDLTASSITRDSLNSENSVSLNAKIIGTY